MALYCGAIEQTVRVFQLQKKIRIVTGSRTFCKPLFQSLEILTLPSQYILHLTKFCHIIWKFIYLTFQLTVLIREIN